MLLPRYGITALWMSMSINHLLEHTKEKEKRIFSLQPHHSSQPIRKLPWHRGTALHHPKKRFRTIEDLVRSSILLNLHFRNFWFSVTHTHPIGCYRFALSLSFRNCAWFTMKHMANTLDIHSIYFIEHFPNHIIVHHRTLKGIKSKIEEFNAIYVAACNGVISNQNRSNQQPQQLRITYEWKRVTVVITIIIIILCLKSHQKCLCTHKSESQVRVGIDV